LIPTPFAAFAEAAFTIEVVYYADLEICSYNGGPFASENWAVPLLAVGWLEQERPFSIGPPPDGLAQKLTTLIAQMRHTFSQEKFRGVKTCSLCEFNGRISPGPIWSQENLFVPGKSEIYLAPGGIVHYVEEHSYLPPVQFVQAVLSCPPCDTRDYLESLRASNRGIAIPLVTAEIYRSQIQADLRRIVPVRRTKP